MALTRRELKILEGLRLALEQNPQGVNAYRILRRIQELERLDGEPPEAAAVRLEVDGEYDRARTALYAALSNKPDSLAIPQRLGNLCFKMDRTREGVALWMQVAEALEKQGMFMHARACVERALREANEDPLLKQHSLRLYMLGVLGTRMKLPSHP